MSFTIVSRNLLRTSKEILERGVNVGAVTVLNGSVDIEHQRTGHRRSASSKSIIKQCEHSMVLIENNSNALIIATRKYSKKHASSLTKRQEEDSDSDSDSDDEFERNRKNIQPKTSERGDTDFWRRKMRTLHRILDVNHDGVVSFDDFKLLAKRFTDLGHLTPELSAEFEDVMKQTWEEQFGEITPYNLLNAEQFLTDIHHRLNDKKMAKRIGRFLPYLFKAVDYDHSGHLDLDQYKLFFRCLGLSDEDAAISFAVIDKNSDGQISMKEFVHLGRQFFMTEDETKISKMFWGPLIDH
ncbi:sarcoplasmic calcium-binding protein-like [Teleopsis dalmanni]|uniref:sarcoplasmic calcium-binding protein-like n=1 Tax=Teleopsis dalmanni TaxID=139649 RepID=UPI000D32B7AD|nr:sarcoplasmic calcium-binding protein-like [Teleopsis dalmanni]XP_037935223.1 sarcoplasmic calcium-binding protein-like [Teleopsis dalmanni]